MQSPRWVARIALISLSIVGTIPSALASGDELSAKQSAAVIPQARTDPWWIERHEASNARAKKGGIDLVWIGDSITQGWESAGQDVWQRYYGDRNAANLGFSGDRTQHVLWRLEHGNVDNIAPKVVIIMIGTNNSNRDDFTADEIADGVRAIVNSVRQKLPEARILLLGIFPRGERSNAQREKIAEVNSNVAKVADGNDVRYMDIGDVFLDDEDRISPKFMPDFLHLSPAGYERWAKAIEPVLVEMLGEESSSNRSR